ncbi:hypothetical protein OLP62_13705 [Bhargavaea beijingensis]|nr:hypothetical protein [Bhargavaea beijingensis]MCW1929349.1 hypothetical protein [Bhargavaea beijingensis]
MNAFSNPAATFNTIKTAISESYERDRVNGDANSRAHWVTYALGTAATSIVGTKGANALVKTGTTAAKASVPTIVSATNHASASLANLLPYTPRPQLAMAGGIPYNVVNGVQLKDQLITMAKAESGVNGVTEKAVTKGTDNANHPIRTYRNADLNKMGEKYTADPRITVEMPYEGKGKSGTNAEGWLRNKDFYWKE